MRKDVTDSGQECKILEITSPWSVPTGITAAVKLRRNLCNRFYSTVNINQFWSCCAKWSSQTPTGRQHFSIFRSNFSQKSCCNVATTTKLFSNNSMSLFLSSSLGFQAILLLLGFNCTVLTFCMFFGLCWNQCCGQLWYAELWYHRASAFLHAYFSSLIEDKSTFVLVAYSL